MIILLANTQHIVSKPALETLIMRLPNDMKPRAKVYKSEQSAINYCVGRLMLIHAIATSGGNNNAIDTLRYTSRGKPLIDGLHFNIAHSSHYVAMAYSTTAPMGLDLEYPQTINLPDFKPWFRPDEWADIQSATLPLDKFYWYWVRKEAILKATSLSLSAIPNINIYTNNTGNTGEGSPVWHLKSFSFGDSGLGLLACEDETDSPEIVDFNLESFL